MFTLINGQGFQLSFHNGYTLSIMFGHGNYCDNYTLPITSYDSVRRFSRINCINAEVAIIDPNNGMCTEHVWPMVFNENLGDSIATKVTMEQVCALIAYLNMEESL